MTCIEVQNVSWPMPLVTSLLSHICFPFAGSRLSKSLCSCIIFKKPLYLISIYTSIHTYIHTKKKLNITELGLCINISQIFFRFWASDQSE